MFFFLTKQCVDWEFANLSVFKLCTFFEEVDKFNQSCCQLPATWKTNMWHSCDTKYNKLIKECSTPPALVNKLESKEHWVAKLHILPILDTECFKAERPPFQWGLNFIQMMLWTVAVRTFEQKMLPWTENNLAAWWLNWMLVCLRTVARYCQQQCFFMPFLKTQVLFGTGKILLCAALKII